ncbi:MAG: sensor histidine kinase [Gammaproteobacteria bacterium]|nr:MAG: sensor histidine kinase [Gammaproteobacteria bacterium]
MNLKVQLLYKIVLIASLCLTASSFYVLYHANQQAISEATFTANSIEKQMNSQLLQMFSRYDSSNSFPNTELWSDIIGLSGSCIQFVSLSKKRQRSLCDQSTVTEQTWPVWFGSLYQYFFDASFEVKKDIYFNAMAYGSILVTLNTQVQTARAWNNLQAIIGVLFVSIFAVCILVYLTINNMLKPAQLIVAGLEKMRNGELDTRLPSFSIKEWKHTSDAINELARSQEAAIMSNKQLALKLMNIQQDEHRYIARELHDEFGQCLAGINAITASIHQTAKEQHPDLAIEVKTISPITQHMMTVLRNLLTRLRPVDVDDLGLNASLEKLVTSWNNRSKDKTNYQLALNGDTDSLPEPLPVNIYRIVQECLTNIAKHADASNARVILNSPSNHDIELKISDDGKATSNEFDNAIGVGLLGIRERVTALGGQLLLITNDTGGLTISIVIPRSL